jgi:hypothetical protein
MMSVQNQISWRCRNWLFRVVVQAVYVTVFQICTEAEIQVMVFWVVTVEAVRSKTLVLYCNTTQHHNTEDLILDLQCHENLKS